MPTLRQTSFAGGEIAGTLWGRSDLQRYASSMRRMRNFFPSRQGAAISRPGTQYLGGVKTASDGKVRLIPFIYSDDQTYVLEFGNLYVRFWSNGGVVLLSGVPYEVATPYTTDSLPFLKYSQSGDVLIITCSGYAAQQLTRLSHTNWTLGSLSFSVLLPVFTFPEVTLHNTLSAGDSTHPAKEWMVGVTKLTRNSSGIVVESALYKIVRQYDGTTLPAVPTGLPATFYVGTDAKVVVQFVSADVPVADPNFLGYNVYAGRGGVYGLLGTTRTTSYTWTGEVPDFSVQPPLGRDPFLTYSSTGALVSTARPVATTYFEDRRVFAGTSLVPNRLLLSSSGDYNNFDDHLVEVDSEALQFDLASRRKEEIRSCLGLQKLLLFTSSGVWTFGGAEGAALSPSSVQALRQSEVGSSWLDPLVAGNTALYVSTKATSVHALEFDLQRQGFAEGDISAYAQHLFIGQAIVDWAYARDPWHLVYAVRSDGVLLTCTFDREQQVSGWAWHDSDAEFDDAQFENVCVVPEGLEDAVYVVVRRIVNNTTCRYVERFATRVITAAEDAVCLDCSLTGIFGSPSVAISGLGHLESKSVYALADGNVTGPFTVSGGAIELEDAATKVTVGLAYTPELEQLDPAIQGSEIKTRTKQVTQVAFEVDNSRGLQIGSDFDHLADWEQRQVSDSYAPMPLGTEVAKAPVFGTWDLGGRACLRQAAPLPVTVVSVSREVELGDG